MEKSEKNFPFVFPLRCFHGFIPVFPANRAGCFVVFASWRDGINKWHKQQTGKFYGSIHRYIRQGWLALGPSH
jgi:hypothetical protein